MCIYIYIYIGNRKKVNENKFISLFHLMKAELENLESELCKVV